ncbi:hypothetical protein Tco_1231330 [Tanacetum coccineum]
MHVELASTHKVLVCREYRRSLDDQDRQNLQAPLQRKDDVIKANNDKDGAKVDTGVPSIEKVVNLIEDIVDSMDSNKRKSCLSSGRKNGKQNEKKFASTTT